MWQKKTERDAEAKDHLSKREMRMGTADSKYQKRYEKVVAMQIQKDRIKERHEKENDERD